MTETISHSGADTCTWRGINPDGGDRGGRVRYHPASIASITEAYYADGWQELTVWLGWDETGEVVARIETSGDGNRTWWAAQPYGNSEVRP